MKTGGSQPISPQALKVTKVSRFRGEKSAGCLLSELQEKGESEGSGSNPEKLRRAAVRKVGEKESKSVGSLERHYRPTRYRDELVEHGLDRWFSLKPRGARGKKDLSSKILILQGKPKTCVTGPLETVLSDGRRT